MYLNLKESDAACGMNASSEAERAYWQSREGSYIAAAKEIDVHAFHDALGQMPPLNWACGNEGETETFMLAEMICGNVAEIYARSGVRYFRLRDYANLGHAAILTRVKEVYDLNQK
ncbi:hypothetical protein [Scandinavium goeteborgense]|uniref:Uncharacterized protein n=1 Tax=Scandinavium goeteborgense TaxID=1851514 RepID=A0A4R6E377_SCAGO|nr:hypothetical protein [Scandinavium goeteborgense]TDN51509.1 hypothetical protein EC847_11838 [Scandinavium goeteborgense]